MPDLIESILIEDIQEDPDNPNYMTDAQMDMLLDSISEFTFLIPIVVNEQNTIIDGHQRFYAAKHAGIPELPCIKLKNISPLKQKKLQQILNKVHGQHDETMDKQALDALVSEFGKDMEKYFNNLEKEIKPKKSDNQNHALKVSFQFKTIEDYNIIVRALRTASMEDKELALLILAKNYLETDNANPD